MTAQRFVRPAVWLLAAASAAAIAVYAAAVAGAWRNYGQAAAPDADEQDDLLDRFMPVYDIVERHRILVDAPASTVLMAACEQDLLQIPLVRAIFRARETVFRASPPDRVAPQGVLAAMKSLGWTVLAERPGREIVVGAVTQPWEANVVFRPLTPDQFAAYAQPGEVKIVWTLRADPRGENRALFMTETRAVATDASARVRFRRYWSFVSPGVGAIRRLLLRPLKREAERRARVPDAW